MEWLLASLLIYGVVWLMFRPSRITFWHHLAAWAMSNRDAAIVRKARRREYLTAAVEEVRSNG